MVDLDYRDACKQWQASPADLALQKTLYKTQRRIGFRMDDNEPGEIPARFDDYNWEQAFGVAGESGGYLGPDIRPAHPGSTVPLTPFNRKDVRRIFQATDGEHDGPNWTAVFELWDGRCASLSAGCDYTGWD